MAKKAQKNQGTTMAAKANLADKLSLNGDTGIITASDDFLEATLVDTDLTVDIFKKAQEHQMAVKAAVYEAAGPMVKAHAKDNEEVDQYHLSYEVGHHRENIYFNPRAEKEDERVRDVTDYNEPNKGEVTKAMKECSALFDGI